MSTARGRAAVLVGALAAVSLPLIIGGSSSGAAESHPASPTTPIAHVVVLLEENHSFDNVLGRFCTEIAQGQITRPGTDSNCDGITTGRHSGSNVPLGSASDIVAESGHAVDSQVADIDGGRMDGFALGSDYTQYDPLAGPCSSGSCIPNLSMLATRYAVSDRTFELDTSPSFEGHLAFAAATQDGFDGTNPVSIASGPRPSQQGGGWGCDSGASAYWSTSHVLVPSCVPNQSGSLGPNWARYNGPKASYVPTIFDELSSRGYPWRIYGGEGGPVGTADFQTSGYQWTVCPSFAECEYTSERDNLKPAAQVINDAASGNLPAFSIVTPTTANSQHNAYPMSQGDDWIGQVVQALQSGPEWRSTAIFITYDDCGCFYDHVNPLAEDPSWGIRVPMIIVSPYARLGYTDSTPVTFVGILAFVEHNFGLQPLQNADRGSYDYSNAFCFSSGRSGCTPAGFSPVRLTQQKVAPPTPAEVRQQSLDSQDST